MRKFILLTLILLLVMPLAVVAQDNPMDPDEHDNECYTSGLMDRDNDDGCMSEWAWTCGWYLDNWLDEGGWGNPDNFFPDWCAPESLLPPQPEVETPPAAVESAGGVFPGCQSYTPYYVDFGTNKVIIDPMLYNDATCSVEVDADNVKLAYATSQAEANALCGSGSANQTSGNPNIYICMGR